MDIVKELVINSCKSLIDRYNLQVHHCNNDQNGICVYIRGQHILCAEEHDGVIIIRKKYGKDRENKINLFDPNCNCYEKMGRILNEALDGFFMDLARTEYFRRCAYGECGERNNDD